MDEEGDLVILPAFIFHYNDACASEVMAEARKESYAESCIQRLSYYFLCAWFLLPLLISDNE